MTLTSDFESDFGTVIDAQRRVGTWNDYSGLINPYTQATAANKPRLSRADNQENIFLGSQGLFNNTTYWTKGGITVTDNSTTAPDGTTTASTINVTESSAYHHIRGTTAVNPVWISGQTYLIGIRAKAGTHNFVQFYNESTFPSNSWVNFDLANGVVGTRGAGVAADKTLIIHLGDGWFYIGYFLTASGTTTSNTYLAAVSSASAAALETWTPPAGALFYVWGAQARNSLTDSTYIPTTDHPQYAGINGRPALVFNGAQLLTTASTLANLFAADNALLYGVIKAFSTATSIITRSSTIGRGSLYTETNRFQYIDNDGGSKNAVTGTIAANTTYIARFRKTGGNMYMAVDSGSGFVESSPTPVGSTDNMTYTYSIGSGASGFYGQIAAMRTYNVGTLNADTTAYENSIRAKYLQPTKWVFNPFTGSLNFGQKISI